ncbi:MAG: NADH-quinone oxidoreductase subunit J [Egibacteraceae bacterium]
MTGALTAVLAQVQPADPILRATSGSAEFWVFWILAPIALGAAISVVMLRNAVHAALMLVVNLFVIALLFAVLEAQFLAVVQIIVYAGAIMVLFLFVIMLLGADRQREPGRDRIRGQRPAAIVLGALLLAALLVGVAGPYLSGASACNVPPQAASAIPCRGLAEVNASPGGNVRGIGRTLFTTYVWPFEVASVLLVIAALGAIILGRKREDPADLFEAPADRSRGASSSPDPSAGELASPEQARR